MDDPGFSDQDFRMNARALLAPWAQSDRRTGGSRAGQDRERLANDRRRIRPLLKSLIPIQLEGAPGNPVIKALRELEDSYRNDWDMHPKS
jgi:hypothetical protein